jgi:WD40 repeat protein/tetratricopeptide (TPR) repeat protein
VGAERGAGQWNYISTFSPDGRSILSAGSGGAWIWDAKSGKAISEALGHTGTIRDAAFSPDGEYVITAGLDGRAMAWSRYGEQVSIPGKDSEQLILDHGQPILVTKYSPDGLFVLTLATDGTVRLWDSQTGTPVGPELPFSLTQYRSESAGWIGTRAGEEAYATFSPEGRRIVVTGWDGIARLWDLATGELKHGPLKPAVSALFSDGSISSPVYGLRVKEILASGRHTRIDDSIWDLETGLPAADESSKLNAVTDNRPKSPAPPYHFEVDKRGVARILNAESGEPMVSLHPPDPSREKFDNTTRSAFSANGRWIATGGSDGGARVWQVATGLPLTPILRHSGAVDSIRFGTEDHFLNIIADKGAWVWDLSADTRSVEQLDQLSAFLGARELDASGALVPIPTTAFRDDWESLHKTHPQAFQVPLSNSISWHLRSAALAESRHNWPGARQHLKWLLENDSRRWPLLLRHARACMEQGDLDSAVDGFTHAIDGGATHWLAWYLRGQIHVEQKAWDDACADYEVIVAQSGWNRQIASDLVLLAAARKPPAEFESLVGSLIDHTPPGELDNLVTRARITYPALLMEPESHLAVVEQRYLEAKNALQRLRLEAPLLYRSGRYPEAQKAFGELESISGRSLDPWLQSFNAMNCKQLGQTDKARVLLSQVEGSLHHQSTGAWRRTILLEAIVREARSLIGQ